MKVAILKETYEGETRVAASPETVKKLVALGADVAVQSDAGDSAYFADAVFAEMGATIANDYSDALNGADVVFKVRPPTDAELGAMKQGALVCAMFNPYGEKERLAAYAQAGVVACAMELMPRITRAQSMDVLSSQSNLAGYKAVLDAAAIYPRALPMMMTAAGTVAAARIFIMGAGVAGLQAIATARRLGAIVTATDVRAAAKEQVESLGASFVMVESEESGDGGGGYAKEMSDEYRKKQAELVAEHIKKQDIVITTALIPGRPAPELVSEEMVKSMKPGAILVDLAVEQGGNCPLSRPGEIVDVHGVRIMGHKNVPGRLPVDASSLYAKNLLNFLTPLVDKESKELNINWEDEIITGVALTRDGSVIHPNFLDGGN